MTFVEAKIAESTLEVEPTSVKRETIVSGVKSIWSKDNAAGYTDSTNKFSRVTVFDSSRNRKKFISDYRFLSSEDTSTRSDRSYDESIFALDQQNHERSKICILWVKDIEEKLNILQALEPNWDSYNSPSITQPAISNAKKLINLAKFFESIKPNIFPVPGGGIQVEWKNDERELEIEILPNGTMMFLCEDNFENKSKEGCLLIENTEELIQLIAWINKTKFKGKCLAL